MDTPLRSQRSIYLPAVIEDIARRLIEQRQEANDHIRRVLDCSTTVGCRCEFCTSSDEEYVEDEEEEEFGEDPMLMEGGDSWREDGDGQIEELTVEEGQEDEEEEEFEYENP